MSTIPLRQQDEPEPDPPRTALEFLSSLVLLIGMSALAWAAVMVFLPGPFGDVGETGVAVLLGLVAVALLLLSAATLLRAR